MLKIMSDDSGGVYLGIGLEHREIWPGNYIVLEVIQMRCAAELIQKLSSKHDS